MKKFKKIYIEITNVCNLNCTFCPTTNRKSKFMSVDEFTFILDAIKDYTDYIYLHVKGEPLLHPDLGQLLNIACKKGFKVNITTNGTLLNNKKEILLNNPCLRQINISLHSFDGNERKGVEPLPYESNKKRDKDEYINNVLDFIEDAKDINTLIIALRLWNLSSKDKQISLKNKYIIDKLEERLDFKYSFIEDSQTKRGIKIRDRLYLNEDEEFIWPDLDNDVFGNKGFCYGLRDQIGILVDGTVIPCCLDGEGKINLGNIFNISLDYILSGDRSQNIYKNFSNRIIIEELCKRCGYRTKFNTPNHE